MPVATRRAPASYRLSQRDRLLHGQGEMAGHLMPLPAARLKGGRAGAAQIRCMGAALVKVAATRRRDGDGTSPVSRMRWLRRRGSGTGMAEMSAWV
jgi:hypothetical protein